MPKLHLKRGKKVVGPFSPATIKQMVADGKVKANDLLRVEGDNDWIPASEISSLATLFVSAKGKETPSGSQKHGRQSEADEIVQLELVSEPPVLQRQTKWAEDEAKQIRRSRRQKEIPKLAAPAARTAAPIGDLLHRCPACANSVSKQAENCPKCGHPFRFGERQVAGQPSGGGSSTSLICSACGSELPSKRAWTCPSCRHSTSQGIRASIAIVFLCALFVVSLISWSSYKENAARVAKEKAIGGR